MARNIVRNLPASFAVGALALAAALLVTRPDGGTVVEVDRNALYGTTPALDIEQRNSAVHAVLNNRAVHGILHGLNFSVSPADVLPWTDADGFVKGAIVYVGLSRAYTISATWIDLMYDCADAEFKTYPYAMTRGPVTGIFVVIALPKGRIFGIMPGIKGGSYGTTPKVLKKEVRTCAST